MKKVKIIVWIIVVVLVGLLFFQNQDFFLNKQGIKLNIYVDAYQSPPLPLVVWFVIVLLIGLLASYFFGLPERFRLKKTIKGLNAKIDAQVEMISQIRSELESRTALPDEKTPAAPVDIVKAVPEPKDMEVSSDE